MMEGGSGMETFPSISAIIKALAAIYPEARITKAADEAGDLCVKVVRKDGFEMIFSVRDCQGSGYFITEIPERERQ
jgi:hypothetical protein